MKIAIGLIGYECAEHLETALKPWLALREKGHDIFISLVHGIFPETHSLGYPVDSKDGTWDLMLKLKGDRKVNHIDKFGVPKYEFELRNANLEAVRETMQPYEYFWLLDHDEFYTEDEILAAYEFAKKNDEFNWFKINFKNYVIRPGLFINDFVAPRIWKYQLMDRFIYDNEVVFTDGSRANDENGTLISKDIVFPKHYSWVGSPEYLKRKVNFQRVHHHGVCSFKWIEETQSLDFDMNYYIAQGKDLPVIYSD